jgi:hypothetical protein
MPSLKLKILKDILLQTLNYGRQNNKKIFLCLNIPAARPYYFQQSRKHSSIPGIVSKTVESDFTNSLLMLRSFNSMFTILIDYQID